MGNTDTETAPKISKVFEHRMAIPCKTLEEHFSAKHFSLEQV
jgi:hypothetical protein